MEAASELTTEKADEKKMELEREQMSLLQNLNDDDQPPDAVIKQVTSDEKPKRASLAIQHHLAKRLWIAMGRFRSLLQKRSTAHCA